MAEAVISPIATLILEKLSSLIGAEMSSLWGLRDELEKLNDTVSRIRAVLLDAEEKPCLSHQEKDLVRKLRDSLYDAEDLIDRISYEARLSENMEKGVCISFPISKLASRRSTCSQLKQMRERLDSIAKDAGDFKIEISHKKRPELIDRGQTCSLVHEKDVIGRDGDKDAIIKLLVDSDTEDVSFMSIVGIGGLGKTALAQLVFNDPAVKVHFEQRMWVCVSDEFDVKIIIQKMVESATEEKPGVSEMEALQKCLQKVIEGKKYLVVLNDVWIEDHEKWQRLRALLMGGAKRSKIMITTRNKLVGEVAGVQNSHIHTLKGLSSDESMHLFEKIAFKQREESKTSELVSIGKEIVKKCYGVPLAIKTMGALLSTKRTYHEWSYFKAQEFSTLTQKENDIWPILRLSYDYLPSHLKQCFGYCSLFPKDEKILMQRLITLWIAQGFIQSSNKSEHLEDVGYQYFMHLLWFSFFQEPEEDSSGNIIRVKMHDLIHDLAIDVAKPECTVVIGAHVRSITQNTRHMSFHGQVKFCKALPSTLCGAKRMRTFHLHFTRESFSTGHNDEYSFARTRLIKLMSVFKCLRVLDFCDIQLKILPVSICELKHLRYLNLMCSKLERLPNDITMLQNLQTLELSYNNALKELPRDLKRLKNLRHLYLLGCNRLLHMPRGTGQLNYLQTLSLFVVGKSKSKFTAELSELKNLCSLRGSLNIHILRKHGAMFESEVLRNKMGLDSLLIDFGPFLGEEASALLDDEAFSESILELPNLNRLRLRRYKGKEPAQNHLSFRHSKLADLEVSDSRCRYIPGFAHLPRLKSITLSDLPDLISLPPINNLFFLEVIRTDKLTIITNFPSLNHLPSLHSIELVNLHALQELPPLHELPSLNCLILHRLETLEYIQEECFHSCLGSSISFFPSLKRLSIQYMTNLKGWWKQPIDRGNDSDNVFKQSSSSAQVIHPHFPVLSKLNITGCPELISLAFFPYVEVLLIYPNASELLQQQLEHMMDWRKETIFSPFSKMKFLQTDNVQDLPEGLLQNFTSLKDMHILHDMISLPEKLLSLSILESLSIWSLKILPDWIVNFTSLHSLTVSSGSTTLPEGLDQLTSLKELILEHCHKLRALPESITALTSLQELRIHNCANLSSLPDGLPRVTSLKKLDILMCPKLAKRCKKNRRADWAKITHIPLIQIDRKIVSTAR